MVKKYIPFILPVFFLFIFANCSGSKSASQINITEAVINTQLPTAILVPTQTITPTSSPTFAPTATQTLTATPTTTLHYPVIEGTEIPFSGEVITAENFNQIEPLASWGEGDITNETISPDGKIIAIARTSGIYLYDAQTMEPGFHITTSLPALSLAFSPDSETIAIGHLEGGVSLLRKEGDGYVLQKFENVTPEKPDRLPLPDLADYVAFSPDGQMLISNYNINNSFSNSYLWKANTGDLLMTLENVNALAVAFSPDSSYLVVPVEDQAKFIKISDGSTIQTIPANNITYVRLSPDGQILAAVCENVIRPIRISDGLSLGVLEGSNVSFSPDNKTLATDAGSGLVRLWELSEDNTRYLLKHSLQGYALENEKYPEGGEVSSIRNLTFSPKGTLLVVSEKEPVGRFWDRFKKNDFRDLGAHETIRLYNVEDGSLLQRLRAITAGEDLNGKANAFVMGNLQSSMKSIFSPDEQKLFTISTWLKDNGAIVIRSWRVNDGSLQNTLLYNAHWDNFAFAFSPDGKTIASGTVISSFSHDPIEFRNVQNGNLAYSLNYPEYSNYSWLMYSTDGNYLTGGGAPEPIFWDLTAKSSTFTTLFTPDLSNIELDQDGIITSIKSPDGSIKVSIPQSGWVGLYFNTSDGVLIKRMDHQKIPSFAMRLHIGGIAFSPDGTLLAIGLPGNIQIWGIRQ